MCLQTANVHMYDTSRYMSRPETVLMRAGHVLGDGQEAIVIPNPIHTMDDGQVSVHLAGGEGGYKSAGCI